MSWILLIFLSWFLLISLWLKFRKEPLPPIDNFSPVRSWFTYQGKTFEGARAYRELAEMLSQRIKFSRAVLEWGSLVRLFRAQLLWRSETHTHTHTHTQMWANNSHTAMVCLSNSYFWDKKTQAKISPFSPSTHNFSIDGETRPSWNPGFCGHLYDFHSPSLGMLTWRGIPKTEEQEKMRLDMILSYT